MEREWIDHALALALGEKRKIMCCGSSPSCIINHGHQGVSKHCFRCGTRDYEPHKHRSVEAIAQSWAAAQAPAGPSPMPDDCLHLWDEDTPSAARVWPLSAGVSLGRAEKAGFKYSPSLNRVLFPVYRDGEYDGFVARSLSPRDMPKYRATVQKMAAQFHPAVSLWLDHHAMVVVEDKLSAMRVQQAGFDAVAVMGTSIRWSDAQIIGSYETVVSWFDADAGGRKGHKDLRSKLSLTDAQLARLVTPKDPKKYGSADITRMIEETLNA